MKLKNKINKNILIKSLFFLLISALLISLTNSLNDEIDLNLENLSSKEKGLKIKSILNAIKTQPKKNPI